MGNEHPWVTIILALVSAAAAILTALGAKELLGKIIDWWLSRKSVRERLDEVHEELVRYKEDVARLTERVDHLLEDLKQAKVDRQQIGLLQQNLADSRDESLELRNQCDRTRAVADAAINALRHHDAATADLLQSQLPKP